jgi:glycosyltransferase involved in cell wall biosynthesis
MKILYLANPLQEGTGGDKRSFEVLKRISSHGIEPVVVVDDFVWQKMKKTNTPLYPKHKIYAIKRPNVVYDKRFKSASRAALDYYSAFRSANLVAQIAEKEKVDFIVSHHEKIDFLIEAHVAARRCQVPWTCIFQLPLLPPYVSTQWRTIRTLRKLYLLGLYASLYAQVERALKSTTPLAVSPSIEADTKSYIPNWTSKMKVLRPGVGVDNQKIRQIEPSKEQVDAVFFSRLAPEKGIYDLPKIASELAKKKPDLRIIIVGRFESSSVKSNFKKLVIENRVTENLVYKGFVEENELFSFLKAAKVQIYPSKRDAFPLVVLEALASGTPVVAYDIPAITSNFQVESVKTVPVGNLGLMATEALKIIGDATLRAKLSEKAVAFASQYSWKNVVEEEVRAYSTVLNLEK